MQERKNILFRVYVVYFALCALGVAILGRVLYIQTVAGDVLVERAEKRSTRLGDIPAAEGNIYAEGGKLLATTVPVYEVRMDPLAGGVQPVFEEQVDSLCYHLADLFQDRTQAEYKRKLMKAKQDSSRYVLIQRHVSYKELQQVKTFPIFRRGRNRGGFIYLKQNKRRKPNGILAARTIGYDRGEGRRIGLEGAYHTELNGVDGKQIKKRISGEWVPMSNDYQQDPVDGSDLYTSIDVNLQDVAETALLRRLQQEDASNGCAILMEVETGFIKAIANLTRDEKKGTYHEVYNHAIGGRTTPGSTFKLAALMAGIEDGFFDITDSVDTSPGIVQIHDFSIKDSRVGGYGKISTKEVFAYSSNTGMVKLITEAYGKQPEKYINRLKSFGVLDSVGFEVKGEKRPFMNQVSSELWSGVSLAQLSIGYEVEQTPLHVLSLYNTVANNGKMMKPKLVKEIRHKGELLQRFEPEVLRDRICSQETIDKVKGILVDVVENKHGTARSIRNPYFKIAGKTGTAQLMNAQTGNYVYGGGKKKYQASFVGYFPADNPKYSCIVVVSAPNKNKYYASQVAAPIFKEIAYKVYANNLKIQEQQNQELDWAKHMPYSKHGAQHELKKVWSTLDIPYISSDEDAEYVVTAAGEKEVEMGTRKIIEGLVPNVVGMGLVDALYLLESVGMRVEVRGSGTVKKQSIGPGVRIASGNRITIELAS